MIFQFPFVDESVSGDAEVGTVTIWVYWISEDEFSKVRILSYLVGYWYTRSYEDKVKIIKFGQKKSAAIHWRVDVMDIDV